MNYTRPLIVELGDLLWLRWKWTPNNSLFVLSFSTSMRMVYCRINKLSTNNSSETPTQGLRMKLGLGTLNSMNITSVDTVTLGKCKLSHKVQVEFFFLEFVTIPVKHRLHPRFRAECVFGLGYRLQHFSFCDLWFLVISHTTGWIDRWYTSLVTDQTIPSYTRPRMVHEQLSNGLYKTWCIKEITSFGRLWDSRFKGVQRE